MARDAIEMLQDLAEKLSDQLRDLAVDVATQGTYIKIIWGIISTIAAGAIVNAYYFLHLLEGLKK